MGQVVAAATVWGLFSLWLILTLLRMPRPFGRAATALLGAELIALMVWGYGRDGCGGQGCHPGMDVAHSLAFLDFPLLSATLAATVVVHGLRSRK